MKDLLDPWGLWLVRPGTGDLQQGNLAPVAVDDSLSVPRTSGPVVVAVLDNDADPEGAALTLVSAYAALGTASANPDGTVTYTPPVGVPPGAVEYDTVVYEIADPLDQRDTGQINVTIEGPDLQINVTPTNTLVVIADASPVDLTISDPPEFAGTYSFDVANLATGPVSLVAPQIAGTPATNETLSAIGGLWAHDTSAVPVTQSWQWQRGGSDIPGETSAAYTMQAEDHGPGIAVVETRADQNGSRSAASTPLALGFVPGDDTGLLGWWDANDTATITADGTGKVSSWADKAGGNALIPTVTSRAPFSGLRSLNGMNAIDFNGTQFLEAARSFPADGDFAFHVALAIDSVASAFEALFAVDAVNDFQIDANTATQFDGRLNLTGMGPSVAFSGGPFSGALILSAVFDFTQAKAEVFVSGSLRATTAYTVKLETSAALHLMTNRSKNVWFNGAVAEVILSGDVTNRADHHAYLATKWGLV